MTKNPAFYIDNKRLFKELCDHKKACRTKKKGELDPIVNRYIGECIMLLAYRISTKKCFSGYSFVEEMISDGVENCIQYGITNFDPERANAFSYFTQIISWAFIRRIQREKKQQYIKLKNMQNHQLHEQLINNSYMVTSNKESWHFIQKFEDGVAKKKNKRKAAANAIVNVEIVVVKKTIRRKRE